MKKKWIKSLIISCFMLLVCLGLSACMEKDNTEEDNTKYTLNIYVDNEIYQTAELEESEIETYTLPTLNLRKDNLYYFSGWTGDVENNKLKINENLKTLTVKGTYKPIFSVSQNGELSVDANDTTKSFTELTIPESINGKSVLSIKDYAFRYFNNLKTIVLPASLQSIGTDAFYECFGLMEVINLSTINIEVGSVENGGVGFHAYFVSNNINDRLEYQNIDGTLYVDDNEHLIAVGVEDRNTKEIIINENTDSISNWAFANCRNVEKVYFNATACFGLPTTTHSTYAVGADSKNVTVYVAANVKSIPDRLFMNSWSDDIYGSYYGATYIKNIIFANQSQCESIGEYAFDDCIYLESIEIPHNVKYIGAYAYTGCVNVNVVNYNAINCTNLSYLTFSLAYSDEVREIVVNIGKDVQRIPDYLFGSGFRSTSTSISQLNFEEDSICESIGKHAFSFSNFTKIILPNSIKTIDNWAFGDCESLTEIHLPTSLETIGEGAFQNCKSLEVISIPNNVTEIKKSAFGGSALSTIILPSSIETIGFTVFYNCDDLTQIYYLGNSAEWDAVEKSANDFESRIIYFYIENQADVPSDNGNYWHYDKDGKTPIIWEVA